MTDNNIIQCSFQDQLRIEGINFKGFGILPKYVMLDSDLSIESKTIYAYFCSFAGNGNTTFPNRNKILSDLPMSKDSYYKHFHFLTEQGYITVEQTKGEKAVFGRNIYTLISNPKKFEDKPEDKKHALAYSRIRFSGLKAAGFGMIPKAVMLDTRLPVKAKGIYAYFCSFTGAGNNAFPRLDKILFHLHINKDTYYKYFKLLQELNYLTVVQRRIEGKMSINDYYLNETPDIDKAIIQSTKSSFPKNQDTVKPNTEIPFPKIPDTVKSDTVKPLPKIPDTVKQDTNINNPNINNYYINSSINQSSNYLPNEGESDNVKIAVKVKNEILLCKKIPNTYLKNNQDMTAAIHFMTDWETFYPKGYTDELKQRIYNLFVEALIEMCCTDVPMKLKGNIISQLMVVNKINELTKFESTYVDISEFSEPAMNNFLKSITNQEINNPMKYMKACIWDSLQTGSIDMIASLKRNTF